ncbi:hypothetical protein [Nocardioides sp. Iso805N]|nr:hypothetical protein [Nocardioides sp. Iso805N]
MTHGREDETAHGRHGAEQTEPEPDQAPETGPDREESIELDAPEYDEA